MQQKQAKLSAKTVFDNFLNTWKFCKQKIDYRAIQYQILTFLNLNNLWAPKYFEITYVAKLAPAIHHSEKSAKNFNLLSAL